MRMKVRVWDSVRHVQAQGLARRIQSAAKLRIRHRALAENKETRALSIRINQKSRGEMN